MANIKISELTALTPPDAADLVPVVDTTAPSSTKRTTVGEIVGIVNGDVDVDDDGTATISELPVSKLQDGSARQLLQTDAAGTGVEWTSNVDVPGTLDVTAATTLDAALNVAGLASLDGGIDVDGAFTVADTSGNVATSGTLGVDGQSTLASAAVSDLTSGRVVLAGTSGELEDSAGLTFNGTQLDVDGNVVITGDLTVEGASTILETETVKVEDKNIELGVVASPTDVTADGGGITLKGTTDKTINWVNATDSWTSSEHVDLASGKGYRINGTEVLSSTTLGSGVTGSSLTSVGTLGSLTVTGDLTVDTNTLYVDAVNNRVGVGTTSVNTTLEVLNSSTPIIRVGDGIRHVQLWGGSSTQNQAVGTATAAAFGFNINSSEVARFDTSGRLLVGTSSDSGGALLQVNGDRVRIATAKTPASASATGTAGEVCWDTNYIYVCTATNTWKRAALSTW